MDCLSLCPLDRDHSIPRQSILYHLRRCLAKKIGLSADTRFFTPFDLSWLLQCPTCRDHPSHSLVLFPALEPVDASCSFVYPHSQQQTIQRCCSALCSFFSQMQPDPDLHEPFLGEGNHDQLDVQVLFGRISQSVQKTNGQRHRTLLDLLQLTAFRWSFKHKAWSNREQPAMETVEIESFVFSMWVRSLFSSRLFRLKFADHPMSLSLTAFLSDFGWIWNCNALFPTE